MELKPITRHALGMQVELGTLFDARSSTFYSSYSLWNLRDINKHQRETPAPDTKFTFSSSLKDTRKNSGLDVEGSAAVDFGIFKLSGSAKYLEDKQRNSNEARVDVTCTRVNKTRAIPMEVMTKMTYNDLILSRPEITHFVAEVVEGAVGNITFIKRCRSSEEEKKISGSLSGVLKKFISMKGDMSLDWKEGEKENCEDIQIYVEGAIKEAVTNVEDAARVGKKLPETLSNINNTLTMTLLPISNLDSKAQRLVRELDEELLIRFSTVLNNAKITAAEVLELQELAGMEMFPKIKDQCLSFQESFNRLIASFRQKVREILPKLKDGSMEENVLMPELIRVVEIMRQQVNIAKKFVSKKNAEDHFLGNTMKHLEKNGLKNCLMEASSNYAIGNDCEQVMLNLYVSQNRHHHLEKELGETSKQNNATKSDTSDSDEEGVLEWFEEDQSKLHNACNKILQFNKTSTKNMSYGFCSLSKAYSVDGTNRIKTSIGDLLLRSNGKIQVISDNYKPKAPTRAMFAAKDVPKSHQLPPINSKLKSPFDLKLTEEQQEPEYYDIEVCFQLSWKSQENRDFPTTGYLVRWRRVKVWSGAEEAWKEERVDADTKSFRSPILYSYNTAYEFDVSTISKLGRSAPCPPVSKKTPLNAF